MDIRLPCAALTGTAWAVIWRASRADHPRQALLRRRVKSKGLFAMRLSRRQVLGRRIAGWFSTRPMKILILSGADRLRFPTMLNHKIYADTHGYRYRFDLSPTRNINRI